MSDLRERAASILNGATGGRDSWSKWDREVFDVVDEAEDVIERLQKQLVKAREMRNAIDMIEGALMGAGELIDIPDKFEDSRDDLLVMPKITLGQLRRITQHLSECTRIINSNEYVLTDESKS